MINVLIFLLHIIFIAVVFTVILKKDSLSDALTNAALIVLIFSVGWAVCNMVLKIFLEPQGFSSGEPLEKIVIPESFEMFLDMLSKELTRDTLSLIMLTIGEFFFFKSYYKKLFTSDDKEK